MRLLNKQRTCTCQQLFQPARIERLGNYNERTGLGRSVKIRAEGEFAGDERE
jgi:hypothetical protein